MKRYANKVIVVKFGGNAMGKKEYITSFANDIVLLQQVGMLPVVVHGGGPQIGEMLSKLKIKTEFIKLPMTVYDSQANFIFIKLVKGVSQQKKLNKHLLSHSIIIRTLDNYNMSDCIRVTIGTEKENKLLINSFKSFFKNEK